MDDTVAIIRIPRVIEDGRVVDAWEREWELRPNVLFEIDEDLSADEIRRLAEVFVVRLPGPFSNAVLSELAERENTPPDVLEVIFESGDSSCQVAVCLRADVPDALLRKCLNSTDPHVLEHVVFSERVSIEDCRELLRTERAHPVFADIERAIAMKRLR